MHSGIATPLSSPGADTVLLDLRTKEDFRACRLPHSINLALETLDSETCSPFEDSCVLEKQWLELESLFQQDVTGKSFMDDQSFVGQEVLVVCYDGDTSRVATSILRAKGSEAFSMRGGIRDMLVRWPELQKTYLVRG